MSEQFRLNSENRAPAGSAALLVLAVALALTASPAALAAAPITATSDDAQSSAPQPGLLARLLRLDPGARLGGNTHVASGAQAVLVGVPGRVNFMIGLGPRQRIMGGARHDQLGARGAGSLVRGGRGNDLIHGHHGRQVLSGGRGHDHIFGGRGRDRLHGGPGNDRLVDHQGATVVITGTGLNRVDVADGDGDERVVCTRGSINRIRVDRGDRLHPRCRRATSSVSYLRPARAAPAARAAQQQTVSGAGTHDNPYTAACDDETQNPCVISAFAARSLTGLWANEYVPAYKCPTSHPYLYNKSTGLPAATCWAASRCRGWGRSVCPSQASSASISTRSGASPGRTPAAPTRARRTGRPAPTHTRSSSTAPRPRRWGSADLVSRAAETGSR